MNELKINQEGNYIKKIFNVSARSISNNKTMFPKV